MNKYICVQCACIRNLKQLIELQSAQSNNRYSVLLCLKGIVIMHFSPRPIVMSDFFKGDIPHPSLLNIPSTLYFICSKQVIDSWGGTIHRRAEVKALQYGSQLCHTICWKKHIIYCNDNRGEKYYISNILMTCSQNSGLHLYSKENKYFVSFC